jgi:hypothetical protein
VGWRLEGQRRKVSPLSRSDHGSPPLPTPTRGDAVRVEFDPENPLKEPLLGVDPLLNSRGVRDVVA